MDLIYLDNAATSFPRPDCVADAVSDWVRSGAAAGRGTHQGAAAANELLRSCRTEIAALAGAESAQHVVLTSGCTESLNIVIQGLLQQGDHVIASRLDHNSVLRPLQHLQQTRNITFELLDFDPLNGLLDIQQLQLLLERTPTRLVVLNHGSNVLGTVQPVAELARVAQQAGALTLVDAAQTAGHEELNFTAASFDFMALAGHKGIPGPLGTGALCIRPDCEQLLQPLILGGTGTESESLLQPLQCPARFESGNRNIPGIAGLLAAAEWIREQTPAVLRSRLQQHSAELWQGLRAIAGVQLLTPDTPENFCGAIAFQLKGLDCHDAAVILEQEFQIQCRAGLHCAPLLHAALGLQERSGSLRFSPGPMTTSTEIQLAVKAVAELSENLP